MIVSTSRTIHPQSAPSAIGGTVLKESEDLDILGVTFDSNMTFKKHLRSVSRAASVSVISWGSPGKHSVIDYFLGDAFIVSVLGVLFCIVVFGCRYTLKLLDRVVSGACFISRGVFECNIAHRRSLAVLCILYKMHNFHGDVSWCCTCVVRARYVRFCRTSVYLCASAQYRRTFIPVCVERSCWPCNWWCETSGFEEQVMFFYWSKFYRSIFVPLFYHLSFYRLVFNTPLDNHSKTKKCYLYRVIPIWNSLRNLLKNCTYKFTFKQQMPPFMHPNLSNV